MALVVFHMFRPKGSMCLNCTNIREDCSHLPFNEMKKIGEDREDAVLVVKCSEYKARN